MSVGGPAHASSRRSASDVAALTADSTPVVIVSSGAIALGLGALGRDQRPRRLAELQAASAVGQSLLLRALGAGRSHGATSEPRRCC